MQSSVWSVQLVCVCLLMFALRVNAAPPPAVFVAPVTQVDFADSLEALGTLRANESILLTATVTETVSHIHFDDGERIKAGQILLEMTSAEEHAQLEEAQATVDEAKSQFQRVKSLAAEGTAAKSLLDERKREWETARARLSAIVSRLEDRVLRAPFAGIVGLRNISVGALVEPGDVITTLDDDSIMKLDFSVSSVYLESLRPGLTIVAKSSAWPEREFKGEVKSVDSRIDPITRSVMVRALLPNTDLKLKPGMLMQIDLLQNPRQALVIPEEALQPMGIKQFVLLVDTANENKVVRREVTLGNRRPGIVEIVNGLVLGDRVITDGSLKVRPGQSVSIKAVEDGKQSLPEILKTAQEKPAP